MKKGMQVIDQYERVIANCPLFSGMERSDICRSLEWMNYRFASYRKNQYLHHYEDSFDAFGLVVYGRVKVMIDDIEGNPALMSEVTPGRTFGESLSFLHRQDSNVYICAAEDTGVIWLSPKCLFAGKDHPQVALLEKRFASILAARTLAMNDRIQILSKLSLREKIITFLTFAKRDADSNDITVSMSREEMAVYLGTNRSALSRELSRLKTDGLIDYSRNHFQILF